MEKNNLQSFIAKRIRKIRLQRGMTQEQLEEKADLGVNYAYKLENLATNIKINTLEKVLNALDITITDFFDTPNFSSSSEIDNLIEQLKLLTPSKRNKVLKIINVIIDELK
ncbi:helix-turn-helix transcriptional regulator [Streptococcus dysgalactiae subsp. equisimilis]|uniref:HTH cro/C1-type domain-containing protein n=3 Tax=Streptococcus TaxID=1301 RepID=A0A3P5Y0L2_STRCB|nr:MULTISPECIES: helix-turn-helix transcriptional regulator [Streptococcus]ADX23720.1 DNA-binding protein [Streptococcus dysgalactiae subsp. equisimilis ATCC 12394]MCY7196361.1 helix-turn-helix transcriptional regulator [Streptococcus dysgalactiae]MCY7199494.1 helix-turn-helix transcriptional regulator [Streptococcus dysgalactiae]MCY7206377.1 helix-turn-helix transcriptional regulator [Streptococcus dysgalactiae]MCY7214902.1 helix-turn-helix transcriptional regulator [Streptococcus dysgalactia